LDNVNADIDALRFKVGEIEKNIKDLEYDKNKLEKQKCCSIKQY